MQTSKLYTFLNERAQQKLEKFLPTSQLRKNILSGGIWATLGQALTLVFGVTVSALLARLLTPTDMGRYFFVVSMVTPLSVIGMLGMGQTIVRLVAVSSANSNTRETITAILQTIFWVVFGTILVVSIFLLFGNQLGFQDVLVIWIAVWLGIRVWENFLPEIFRGFNNIREAVFFKQLLTKLISTIFLFVFLVVVGNINFLTAITFLALASFINVVLAIGMLYRNFSPYSIQFNRKNGVLLLPKLIALREALPVLGVNLVTIIRSQVSIWLVTAFLTKEDVAIYGAADRLTVLIATSLSIANAFLPPIIARLYAQGQTSKLERVVRNIATLSSVPAVILILLFIIFGKFILRFTYGEFYMAGWIILVLLGIGQTLNVSFGSCGLTLVMTGHQRTMMKISMISMFLTVIGVFLGVKLGGGVGVALAVTLGLFIQNFLMLFFVKRQVGIWTHMRLKWW